MPASVSVDRSDALDRAVEALRAGGAIVLPTDTVYGLAALPPFVDRLYALKGRPASVPIAVLVASIEQARSVVAVTPAAQRLATAFWPGPLTIVLQREAGDTLGVRCPAHDFVRELARRAGALAVTSANRHGDATPITAAAAAAALAGDVALVIDGGECAGVASTVVDLTGSSLEIVRIGPISQEEIRSVALR
ncbi:MAG TPA: L-threonylcarbamoyladenylate synthase [Acidimicrobiales bacterium]|nr:L-threonylcarbamoyladenylate synthase [Acidimicrobiales bacterium]